MPAHHLHDERPAVARRGLLMASIASVMRWRAVSAPMVMSVPKAWLSINSKRPTTTMRGWSRPSGRDAAGGHEVLQQAGPLAAEQVGAVEAAVAADHDQAVDAGREDVAGGGQPAFARPEPLGPRGADDRAAAVHDAAHRVPAEGADPVAAFDQARVALVDAVDLETAVQAVGRSPAPPRSCPKRRRRSSGSRPAWCSREVPPVERRTRHLTAEPTGAGESPLSPRGRGPFARS